MKSLRIFFFFFLFFFPLFWSSGGAEALAQRSKHGAKTVSTANNIVNEYTPLSLNAAAGATTITVANSSLNTNNRFGAGNNLAAGDLIMIIQMQGATINGSPDPGNPNLGTPPDSSWGAITAYNNCGNWEFAEVISVPNATTINVACDITNSYTTSGKTQVIRVPRYSTLTINNGGVVNCDAWNGAIGGVCAIEVEFNSTINTGGSIDVSGRGFRGAPANTDFTNWGIPWISASKLFNDGGQKGEGIAGYQADYDAYGGRYCKASPANGGGGGNAQNAGGGGGANGGNINAWNGVGVPDLSGAGYANAWNMEFAGLAALSSSGGGKGGYSFSGNNADPTLAGNGPNNFAVWGGDHRRSCGGFGGRPVDYSTGRLFLGGGGGSGNANDGSAGDGSNGGGLIYLMNYGLVTSPGTGQLISNGNNGGNTKNQYKDGAGGGGGGGTIIVNSIGAIVGISLTANGGKGGDQIFVLPTQQAEGPGGGGGGGYIGISNGTPVMNVNGGNNGITNSTGVNQFPPNGATKGGVGTSGAVLMPSVVLNSSNVTICTGQSATLTATLGGNPPPGTTIIWYDALVGGNVLPSAGGVLTTSVINTAGTYTYYAGSCPGTYHLPVTVSVSNFPVVSISPDVTICTGGNTSLTSGGASSYTWSPTTGLSNPNISNPIADPVATTTYVVSAATPCGTGTATVVVTVQSSLTPSISGNTSICAGGNTTLTASGGTSYSWSTGSSNTAITVSPTSTATYTLDAVSGSCTGTASITVNVTSGITASISPGNSTICPGTQTTLTASGGSNYSWSTTETTAAINVAPTSTANYTVTVMSGSCSSTASVTLTISNNLTSTINGPTNICAGGDATLTATGGGTYSWSTTETTASITVTPTSNNTYSVLVSAGTCTAAASHSINVGANITVSIAGNTTICGGVPSTLTASGGSTYSWTTGASTASISINPAPSTSTGYTVFAASGSCADTATVTVTSLPLLVTSVSGNSTICQGSVSTLTASVSDPNNNTYLWSTGATTSSVTLTPSSTTTFTVIGYSDACSDTEQVVVQVVPQASATVSPSTTICSGESTVLTVSGGSVYAWSTGSANSSITVSPIITSSYSVVAGIAACSDTDSVSVTVLPSPTVTVTSSSSSICGGDAVTLNASGGASYVWSNSATSSSTTVNPANTTTYSVIATSGSCNDTGTVVITASPPPIASITGNNNICQGYSATLTAAPAGATYLWSSGEITASINPSTAGNYSVVVSIGSCKDTAYISTTVAPNPTASAFSDQAIIAGQNVDLSASGGSTYVWDNGMTGANITVTPLVTTTFCVTVLDANNCFDTACVTISVESCPPVLYLPNAFSPNGDGENDELQIYYGLPACILKFHLVLYNRWGEKIYETTDSQFKWNGSYKGWILGTQTGGTEVYSYYLKAEFMNGTNTFRRGNISLVR